MILKDKVCVIVGGAGLLGREFVKGIVKSGGIAIIADINKNGSKVLEKEIKQGEKYEFIYMDITNEYSIRRAINYINKKYGRIDALVNSAYPKSKSFGKSLEYTTYENFCENLNKHLGGYFLTSKLFGLFFKKQGWGNIINIASIYGTLPPRFEIYEGTNMTLPIEYVCIKAGIIQLTKYLAKYFKGCNIRVNCISPGGIKDEQADIFVKNYKRYCLNKGLLEPKDVVGTLIFLLSDESKYINGQNIIVDDGFTL